MLYIYLAIASAIFTFTVFIILPTVIDKMKNKNKKQFNKDVKEYISENDLQKAILFAYLIGACAGDIIIATLAEDVLTGGAGNVFRGCLQFAMLAAQRKTI